MKQKFKKGDWVVTTYNKYPVQLEEDGKYGIIDILGMGIYFFECSMAEAAFIFEKEFIYAVKDPRDGFSKNEGYYLANEVRLAKKKDFSPLIKSAKQNIKSSEAQLKLYHKTIGNL